MSRKLKTRILEYFSIVFAWLIVVFLYIIIRFLGKSDNISWATQLRDFVSVGLLAGIIMGTISWATSLLIENTGLKRRSYYFLIIFQLCIIIAAVFFIILVMIVYTSMKDKIAMPQSLMQSIELIPKLGSLSLLITFVIASIILSLLQQMKSIIGGRVLLNLMIGKYHFPRKEKKVFMFLDMQSSTTIAERIGHDAFSRLIQDCFSDLNESVTKFNAEIYKYIGDEAIITWDYKDAEEGHPLNLFFHFNNTLKGRAEYYEKNYGTLPVFKAGLNAGEVTTLEVGVIKKEIAHLSDVLNTAARIQGMCNNLNALILVSENVKNLFPESDQIAYQFKDDLLLRGKEQKVKLYEVLPNL